MSAVWFGVAVGVLCGAIGLRGLYVRASRKAAQTGERASLVFVWALSVLFLLPGLGLCLMPALVWGGAALFGVPIPESERLLLSNMMQSGLVASVFAIIGVQLRRRPKTSSPPP
jgi:hypothetical protein